MYTTRYICAIHTSQCTTCYIPVWHTHIIVNHMLHTGVPYTHHSAPCATYRCAIHTSQCTMCYIPVWHTHIIVNHMLHTGVPYTHHSAPCATYQCAIHTSQCTTCYIPVCHTHITVCYSKLWNFLIFCNEFHYFSNVKFVMICLHFSSFVCVETLYQYAIHCSSLYISHSQALNPVVEFQPQFEN